MDFFLLRMLAIANTYINDVSVIKILCADVMNYTNVFGGSSHIFFVDISLF